MVTIMGETMLISEHCRKHNINESTFHNRLRRGKTGVDLIAPVNSKYRNLLAVKNDPSRCSGCGIFLKQREGETYKGKIYCDDCIERRK